MPKRITIKGAGGQTDLTTLADNPAESEINLFELANTILKRKKIIGLTVLTVMLIAAVVVMILPSQFRSSASILPSGGADEMSELKMLAGFKAGSNFEENSSILFPTILRSQTIQNGVIAKTYRFTHDGEEKVLTLKDYFEIDNPDRLSKALDGILYVALDKKTAVIGLSLETTYPEFSQKVLTEYLAQLENYNLHTRRSQAKENALYLGNQITKIKQEMTAVENNLAQFQMVNLDWAGSTDPATLKELGRLKREVELKSQAYMYLVQEYETAKFDAQKDMPIVRILNQPSLPTIKTSPRRTVIVLLSGLITFLTMLIGIIFGEGLKKKEEGPDQEAYRGLRQNIRLAFPRSTRTINRVARFVNREETTVNI
ncbi:MAG: hypothetical protein GY841_17465 [FCB group bacterium]|nr:hypothetical protein [FCB group bacterium]